MPDLYFGGSFNPIHNGHLICAQSVAENASYKQVVLVPSAQPPHKPAATDLAPAIDRLAMCRLAVAGNPRFSVCDIETRRGGLSYTIDTVRQLQSEGIKEIHWLIGADMLMILPKWHQAEDLIRLAEFVVMARPGWNIQWDLLPRAFQWLKENVVEAPRIDISATEIRQRIRTGQTIEGLTPEPVIEYIKAHHLYQTFTV